MGVGLSPPTWCDFVVTGIKTVRRLPSRQFLWPVALMVPYQMASLMSPACAAETTRTSLSNYRALGAFFCLGCQSPISPSSVASNTLPILVVSATVYECIPEAVA